MNSVASVNLDVTPVMNVIKAVGLCHCITVRNAPAVCRSVQKIVGMVVERNELMVCHLYRHVVPAPDVPGPFKKRVGDTMPVEDFHEPLVCYRTRLRQECRKIHPVAKRFFDHMLCGYSML